jgi:cob(I)alamin adenosyltransferase
MKIYTRTGDEGQTGLVGGQRVDKDHAHIEATGDADELNASIGMARVHSPSPAFDAQLEQIQADLFEVGAELAAPGAAAAGAQRITERDVARLEEWIDLGEADLPRLKTFVLPGGVPLSAQLHLCRAICRRAERRAWTLSKQATTELSRPLLQYLNRLSDLLFVLARAANHQANEPDPPWISRETD